jgi:hypothetical protein
VAARLKPDAPVREPIVELTPASPPLPEAKSRVAPVIFTSAAAAGAIFTVVSSVSAAIASGKLESAKYEAMGMPASHLPRPEADGFARTANGWLTATLISGISTAVLTALSIWLWAS